MAIAIKAQSFITKGEILGSGLLFVAFMLPSPKSLPKSTVEVLYRVSGAGSCIVLTDRRKLRAVQNSEGLYPQSIASPPRIMIEKHK
jgi:hypothetical protein